MNPKSNYDYTPLELANTKITYRLTFKSSWKGILVGTFFVFTLTAIALNQELSKGQWTLVSWVLGLMTLLGLAISVAVAKGGLEADIQRKTLKKFLDVNKLKPIDSRVSNFSWLMFRDTEVIGDDYSGFSIPLSGTQADIINYNCTRRKNNTLLKTEAEKSETYYFTVIGFKLSRQVPDIIIADKSMGGVYKMSTWIKPGQTLKLEGDFNDIFTVYVPEGYEQDALFILTPELMGNIMDYGKGFSFEIVDSYLYIFRSLVTKLNPVNTEQLVKVAEYFSYEFEQNTNRYRDERVDKDITDKGEVGSVSSAGRRLKTFQD